MLKLVSKLFKSEPKQSRKKTRPKLKKKTALETPQPAAVHVTAEDILAGKGLFWGRTPYYPEMGNAYRKLMQRLKIDNQRAIKVAEPSCGADMCTLAGGSGPMIDFTCSDENAALVDKNIIKMGLGSKIDRVSDCAAASRSYFAHITSFYPENVNDADLDWDTLGDTTAPGGYVIISKMVTARGEFQKPKPSEKISDTNEFYFYNLIDHSIEWVETIEKRLKIIQDSDPDNFSNVSKPVTSAFKMEVTEWIVLLQRLKAGEIKVMSVIYKHDDV